MKLNLDEKDILGIKKGIYDNSFETATIKANLKKGDVFLDLGANLGYYTLLGSKLVGENGRVYAFECDEEPYKLLKQNVEDNSLKNVQVIKKAVFGSNGTKRLYQREDNTAGSTLFRVGRRARDVLKKRKYIDVETIRLDDSFLKRIKVDFIKMDIEGSEYSALRGMEEIIRSNPNIKIVLEFYPELIDGVEGIVCSKEMLIFLERIGFSLCLINEKRKCLEMKEIEEIMEECKINRYVNLYCFKGWKDD